jgi:cobalt-zinc-cadmium efflux system outer membrane protein
MQSGVIAPSQSNLKIIQEAYRVGQLRLLDVLNQQRQLVDAQLALIDANADASRFWAELEHAVGGNLP